MTNDKLLKELRQRLRTIYTDEMETDGSCEVIPSGTIRGLCELIEEEWLGWVLAPPCFTEKQIEEGQE